MFQQFSCPFLSTFRCHVHCWAHGLAHFPESTMTCAPCFDTTLFISHLNLGRFSYAFAHGASSPRTTPPSSRTVPPFSCTSPPFSRMAPQFSHSAPPSPYTAPPSSQTAPLSQAPRPHSHAPRPHPHKPHPHPNKPHPFPPRLTFAQTHARNWQIFSVTVDGTARNVMDKENDLWTPFLFQRQSYSDCVTVVVCLMAVSTNEKNRTRSLFLFVRHF